ncbi:hypothetical protein [Pseudochrobactrum sp. MP213Fo]|uniref:hypothetical protein n=1 Tax=Pseudochrobactrum sp. MP213Fo TaxID=3022250 RepID=UPI003B9EF4E1
MQLQMIISQETGPYDPKYSSLKPCNWVNVYGDPGTSVCAKVSSEATITQSNDSNYTFKLDSSGRGSFSVFINKMPSAITTVMINDTSNQDNQANGSMLFNDYYTASGNFLGYCYNNGVVADGKTPCIICIVVNKNLDFGNLYYVAAKIIGDAEILNKQKMYKETIIELVDNSYISIEVYSSSKESAILYLSLRVHPMASILY